MLVSSSPSKVPSKFTGIILDLTQLQSDKQTELATKISTAFKEGQWDDLKLTVDPADPEKRPIRLGCVFDANQGGKDYLVINSRAETPTQRHAEEMALAKKIGSLAPYAALQAAFTNYSINMFDPYRVITEANKNNHWLELARFWKTETQGDGSPLPVFPADPLLSVKPPAIAQGQPPVGSRGFLSFLG